MEMDDIIDDGRKYLFYPWKKQDSASPPVIEKAEGCCFWDRDGKTYLDMSSQLVNMNLGHGNREIIDAIKTQAEKLAFMAPQYPLDVRSHLAKIIIEEIAPDNMGKVFFTLGGSDANEHALRIARAFTGKHKVLSRYRSYHGATAGSANLSGEPRRFPSEPGMPGFVKFFDPYLYRETIDFKSEKEASQYYLAKLEEQILYEGPDQIAAVFIETITGTNGVIIPPDGYLEGLRDICTRYGILLICDEVMTGWGRTGEWFAFMHWKIKPDIITFAKGITCGYVPLGGVIVSREISSYFDEINFVGGLTYSAHPIGCAAGIAAIGAYRKYNVFANVRNMEKVLIRELEALKQKHECLGDVRVKGLFGMIELVKDKKTKEPLVPFNSDPQGIMGKIISRLLNEGFATYSHENMISVSPPLIITEEEIIEACGILDRVLTWVDSEYCRRDGIV